jgi:hypothetical protein
MAILAQAIEQLPWQSPSSLKAFEKQKTRAKHA